MKKKVLVFVVCKRKLLTLRNNSQDSKHGGDFWFVVTGSVEKGESLRDAVKREVKEETTLKTKEIINLNCVSIYKWNGEKCREYIFAAFVDNQEIKLNEEHVKHKWLPLKDFINKIRWDDKKSVLRKVLKNALNKKQLFKKLNVVDYTKG